MSENNDLANLARATLDACNKAGFKMATAESCTGGMIAAALTDLAGSSSVFVAGFVTYSNTAKSQMIDVAKELIDFKGAVSEDVAVEMALGALANSEADVAVSVTGVAGPGGGSAEKPVGTVHMCCALSTGELAHIKQNYGDLKRAEIRQLTAQDALKMVISAVESVS
ncbi:MAG: damage-inducible protein CinA [Hyphomicrobiales bacterium]|nr:MAG: damage-inducible protein CinA [Hyphomicrobiales bacterium]